MTAPPPCASPPAWSSGFACERRSAARALAGGVARHGGRTLRGIRRACDGPAGSVGPAGLAGADAGDVAADAVLAEPRAALGGLGAGGPERPVAAAARPAVAAATRGV